MKKNGNGKIIIIVILIIIIIASLTAFLLYNRVIKNKEDKNIESDINNSTVDQSDKNGNLFIRVDFAFTVTGRGASISGKIERGTVSVGDEVEILDGQGNSIKTIVTCIQKTKNEDIDIATEGDNVMLIFRGLSREQVKEGQVVCTPGTIKPYKKIKANLHMGTAEEGMLEYNLKNNTEVSIYSVEKIPGVHEEGTIKFLTDVKNAKSGDNIEVEVEFENKTPMYLNEKLYIRYPDQDKFYGVLTINEFK